MAGVFASHDNSIPIGFHSLASAGLSAMGDEPSLRELRQRARELQRLNTHLLEQQAFLVTEIQRLNSLLASGSATMAAELATSTVRLRQTDRALREQYEKLHGLYELSPLGIAMLDMNGRLIEFNDAFRHLCGYAADELKMLDYWTLTPPRYAALEAEQMRTLRQTGRLGPYEKEYLRKDGCLVPLLVNGVLISCADARQCVLCLVQDMTARNHSHQLNKVLNEYHELSQNAMERSREQMVSALTRLSLYRDNETGRHIKRTELYVRALAKALLKAGKYSNRLSGSSIDLIAKAAPMHDLGKVGIPDRILLKPGVHNAEESSVMQTHASIGELILTIAMGNRDGADSLLAVASRIAGAHHENWDGSGYPRGRKGEEIPLEARLMALADVYDALTTPRIYKRAWSHEAASTEIRRVNGIKFDPAVVEAFEREEETFRRIAQEFGD